MGLFDSVYVPCPHCGAEVEHQSKADQDPYMNRYTLDDAPAHILEDVLNQPTYCQTCGKWHALLHPSRPPGEPPPRLEGIRAAKVRTPRDEEIGIHSTQPFLRWWMTDRLPFTMSDVDADPAP